MEKIETISFFFTLNHLTGQDVVLLFENGHILRTNGVIRLFRSYNRLHGDLVKAKVRQMQDVTGKIQVPMRISSPDIVLQSEGPSLLRKFQEFGQDQVVAAPSAAERAHPVVDFLPPVNRQDDIVHLPVAELHHLIVKQDPVGRERKTEMLPACLFQFPTVGHKLFDHFPVHQGFPTEKIHFQIGSFAG